MKTIITLIAVISAFFATLQSLHADTKTLYVTRDAAVGTRYDRSTRGNDKFLGIGGQGDMYISLLLFDLTGVSGTITSAQLELTPHYYSEDYMFYAATTGGTVRVSARAWNENGTPIGDIRYYSGISKTFSKPLQMSTIKIDVKNIVTEWVRGSIINDGLILEPASTNNNWTYFCSREYGGSSRPKLVITYTPATAPVSLPSLKLPLPGGKSWRVSTEIGENLPSRSHEGVNYYSIDFAPKSRSSSGTVRNETSVRVYAAGSGVITHCRFSSVNGNYVVIDHDGDKNVSTGIQTRYLHLAFDPTILGPTGPSLYEGMRVSQGQFIGIIGKTGTTSEHLHFGIRYRDSGSNSGTSGSVLSTVKMDGKYMKDFKVGQYYTSTNTR